MNIAAGLGFSARVVVDDVIPGSRGDRMRSELQSLGAIERTAANTAGADTGDDARVLDFALDSAAIQLLLRYVDDPLDLFGDGMPEMLTILDASGHVWFWSDGNEGSCGMSMEEPEWRSVAATSVALIALRTGMGSANLFDAGGAEELVGDLAIPLDWQEGQDVAALRRHLLLNELALGPQVEDANSLLRCLGAAALVLDVRRDCLGALVWRSIGLERSDFSVNDAQVQAAQNIVRIVLSSDLWRETWPETSTRHAVESDLRCLRGVA